MVYIEGREAYIDDIIVRSDIQYRLRATSRVRVLASLATRMSHAIASLMCKAHERGYPRVIMNHNGGS